MANDFERLKDIRTRLQLTSVKNFSTMEQMNCSEVDLARYVEDTVEQSVRSIINEDRKLDLDDLHALLLSGLVVGYQFAKQERKSE